MNMHGVRPRRAPEWSRVTLRQALTGNHILGRIKVGGVVQRDGKGRALTPFPEVLDLPTVVELRKILEPSPDARKRTGRKTLSYGVCLDGNPRQGAPVDGAAGGGE
ncbi:hypothetical protein O7622_17890 [Micromonospora sp. WMMD1076]|nr:hypothetical protein [Micromonospora sp. WMMD1076]WFF04934.1 hypothetical protein O7622_17890 [Micromonospora sp. WMMD1076]